VVHPDATFYQYIGYRLENPPYCPVAIQQRDQQIWFLVTFSAYNERVIPSAGYTPLAAIFLNNQGAVRDTASTVWYANAVNPGVAGASLNTNYHAGSGSAFSPPRDSAVIRTSVRLDDASWRLAEADISLPAYFPKSSSISGPTSALPGDSVTVTVDVAVESFQMVPTYEWTLNGAPVGSNSSIVSTQLQDPGDWTFTATVYDSLGDYARNSFTVHVQYPGCPNCFAPRTDTTRTRVPSAGTRRGEAAGRPKQH